MLAPLVTHPLTVYTILLVAASCLLLSTLIRWFFKKAPTNLQSTLSTQTEGVGHATIVKSKSLITFHDPNLTDKLAPSRPLSKKEQDVLPRALQDKLMDLFRADQGKSFISEAPSQLQDQQSNYPASVRVNQSFNILVINLDTHQSRLQEIAKAFERQGLNWRRIRATYGKIELIDRDEAQDKGLVYLHTNPSTKIKSRSNGLSMYSTGAMGCAVSHIKALHIAATSNKPTVIFEDDMLIRGYILREQLANLTDYLHDYTCDYLFLGAYKCLSQYTVKEIIALNEVYDKDAKKNCANSHMSGKGACAYLVTPEGAKKILEHYAKKENPLRPADYFVLAQDAKGKEIDVRMAHPLWFTTVQAQSSDTNKLEKIGPGTWGT